MPEDDTFLELERQHNYYKQYTEDLTLVSEDIDNAIEASDRHNAQNADVM